MHPQMDNRALLSGSHHNGSSNRCQGGECCSAGRSRQPSRRASRTPCPAHEMTTPRVTSRPVAAEYLLRQASRRAVNPPGLEADYDARLIAFGYLQLLGKEEPWEHMWLLAK